MSYAGEHEAIIDRETWDAVHALLTENTVDRPSRLSIEIPALLKGLLFTEDGAATSPSFTRKKNGRVYRYYVSQTAIKQGYASCPIRSIPAGEIEGAVIDQVRALLRAPEVMVRTWRQTAEDAGAVSRGGGDGGPSEP